MGDLASPFLRSFVSTAKANDTATVHLFVSPSGYMHPPKDRLDPRVFTALDYPEAKIKPRIRDSIISRLTEFWGERYNIEGGWFQAWVSGSALSYQWGTDADPDFDVLIGVDIPKFKMANPDFSGLDEDQLALYFNTEFKDELDPFTANLNGFETTFYVNPGAADIREINPYAAYNLSMDEWTVRPIIVPKDWNPRRFFPDSWWRQIDIEIERAAIIVSNYTKWMNAAGDFNLDDPRTITALTNAINWGKQASAFFANLHDSRRFSFSKGGGGYMGYYNLRWQAHKFAGTANAMYRIRATLAQTETLADQVSSGTIIYDADRSYMKSALFGKGHTVDAPDQPKDASKQTQKTPEVRKVEENKQ